VSAGWVPGVPGVGLPGARGDGYGVRRGGGRGEFHKESNQAGLIRRGISFPTSWMLNSVRGCGESIRGSWSPIKGA